MILLRSYNGPRSFQDLAASRRQREVVEILSEDVLDTLYPCHHTVALDPKPGALERRPECLTTKRRWLKLLIVGLCVLEIGHQIKNS